MSVVVLQVTPLIVGTVIIPLSETGPTPHTTAGRDQGPNRTLLTTAGIDHHTLPTTESRDQGPDLTLLTTASRDQGPDPTLPTTACLDPGCGRQFTGGAVLIPLMPGGCRPGTTLSPLIRSIAGPSLVVFLQSGEEAHGGGSHTVFLRDPGGARVHRVVFHLRLRGAILGVTPRVFLGAGVLRATAQALHALDPGRFLHLLERIVKEYLHGYLLFMLCLWNICCKFVKCNQHYYGLHLQPCLFLLVLFWPSSMG